MKVTYHEAAVAELADAIRFYETRSPGIGRAFAGEILAVVARVIAHPDIGFNVRSGVRKVAMTRFPYSMLYSVSGERLVVLAVMHHRRQPGYWTDRL